MRKSWIAAATIATVVTTMFGLFQIVQFVYGLTASAIYSGGLAAVLATTLVLPFLYYSVRPSAHKEFGLTDHGERFVCLENSKTVQIDMHHKAVVEVTRSLVFTDEPGAEDLVDGYSLSPDGALEDLRYDSPDAAEVDRRRLNKQNVIVHWRPRKAIELFRPYAHTDRWQPPMVYDEPAAYTQFHCIERTGIFRVRVSASRSIERAVAFRRPRWRSLKDEYALVQYALSVKRTGCPQPRILEKSRDILWTITNPHLGDRYMCVYFFDGGVAEWKRRLSGKPWWRRWWWKAT